MRKSESYKTVQENRIIKEEYLPNIKKVWEDNGIVPNNVLNEKNDIYDVFAEEYYPTIEDAKYSPKGLNGFYQARKQVWQTANAQIRLHDFVKYVLCGFYYPPKNSYLDTDSVTNYAKWYVDVFANKEPKSKSWQEHYDATIGFISDAFLYYRALFIAIDVSRYYEERKVCDTPLNGKNHDKHLAYGPFVGQIFDAETRRYRKPVNFEEFTHYLHTRYWFNDPSKGYHINAPYKWDKDVPPIEQLMGE